MVSLIIWLLLSSHFALRVGGAAILWQIVVIIIIQITSTTRLFRKKLVFLCELLLILWLIVLASFSGSLTLTILILNICDQSLLRPVICVRIDHCIDRLEVVSLTLRLLLASAMSLFGQLVVRLRFVPRWEEFASGELAPVVHLGATSWLVRLIIEVRVNEHLRL